MFFDADNAVKYDCNIIVVCFASYMPFLPHLVGPLCSILFPPQVVDHAPLDKVCLLGCGISTGYGAAINTAKVGFFTSTLLRY